jgi:hypothetical protein
MLGLQTFLSTKFLRCGDLMPNIIFNFLYIHKHILAKIIHISQSTQILLHGLSLTIGGVPSRESNSDSLTATRCTAELGHVQITEHRQSGNGHLLAGHVSS